MAGDLELGIVLGAALIDSINPCAIGVILFLSSALLKVSDNKKLLLYMGGVYIATVYVVYMLSGLGLIWFQNALISRGFAEIVGIVVGVLVITLGLIELKDAFWYGKWVSLEISPRNKEKIAKMAENFTFIGIVGIGGFVAMVELPCTGGPYLAITAILAKSFDARAMAYLLIYNLIFVLPLIVILLLLYFGATTLMMKKWRQQKRVWMNLASGMLMIFLGVFLVWYYQSGWYM